MKKGGRNDGEGRKWWKVKGEGRVGSDGGGREEWGVMGGGVMDRE